MRTSIILGRQGRWRRNGWCNFWPKLRPICEASLSPGSQPQSCVPVFHSFDICGFSIPTKCKWNFPLVTMINRFSRIVRHFGVVLTPCRFFVSYRFISQSVNSISCCSANWNLPVLAAIVKNHNSLQSNHKTSFHSINDNYITVQHPPKNLFLNSIYISVAILGILTGVAQCVQRSFRFREHVNMVVITFQAKVGFRGCWCKVI
jgi:hypothetical protein